MARRSVLAARHGWMRSTGLARCRTRCPHAALRSHCDRPSIAHRPWAARARTFTTVGGGAGTPPSAELQQKHRDLRSRALHEAATEALADHWADMRHALVPRRARTQWTEDAASERSNAASGSSGSPVDVAGSKSVATSGPSTAQPQVRRPGYGFNCGPIGAPKHLEKTAISSLTPKRLIRASRQWGRRSDSCSSRLAGAGVHGRTVGYALVVHRPK
jgi:hypothetical protein